MTGGKGTSTRTSLEAYAAEAITPVMNRLIQSLLADRPDDVAAYVVERLAAEPAAPEESRAEGLARPMRLKVLKMLQISSKSDMTAICAN